MFLHRILQFHFTLCRINIQCLTVTPSLLMMWTLCPFSTSSPNSYLLTHLQCSRSIGHILYFSTQACFCLRAFVLDSPLPNTHMDCVTIHTFHRSLLQCHPLNESSWPAYLKQQLPISNTSFSLCTSFFFHSMHHQLMHCVFFLIYCNIVCLINQNGTRMKADSLVCLTHYYPRIQNGACHLKAAFDESINMCGQPFVN